MTVIVPAYNAERFLNETLESILRQTRPAAQILVCDDGSQDATEKVAARFAERVRYLRQDNAGVAAARNLGLSHSTGDFLAFLDADDLWEPNTLELHLEHFLSRPDIDVSVGLTQNFWTEELREEAERLADHRLSRPLLAHSCCATMVRRQVFENIGPFSATLRHASEMEWFTRLQSSPHNIGSLKTVVLRRRLHSDNTSRKRAHHSMDEYFAVLHQHIRQKRSR